MVQDSLAPDSCQDVVRRIAVEACIEGIVGSIVFFPDGQKVLAGKVVLTVVVRDGVSDEDVFRLDVPVAFLNGFMARFPGVGMVPVLGFRFQGGWQGLRLLPIQPESGETTNREGVFSWKGSFQLVLCKQERPGLRLSIFFFHSAPLTVKNGIMLHGRELLKLSCFPRRKTARRVENCWKRSGGNCLSALRLPEGPGNIWQERARAKASHPCCRSCQAREISPWMSSASGSGSAGSRTGAVSAAGDCSVLVLMASRISSTVRSMP